MDEFVGGDRPAPGLAGADYRRAVIGMGASGFSTFALLYCVQPLMPLFSARFGVTPAESSLSLSVSTLVLTVTIFAASILSERFGRKRIMAIAMFGTGLLNLACAAAPSWHALLALRLLEGITAGGVPAVAMAYLSEEMHPARLGRAMGIYIAGNALGGMLGRLLAGLFADLFGWRAAMAALAVMGLGAAVAFSRVLPASRNFRPAPVQGLSYHGVTFATLIRQRQLALLLAFGFLVVGPFVTIYDYAGYRLIAPPYRLGQTAIGAIFLVYVFGIAGSTLSGRVADRVDRRTMLALNLVVVLAGLLLTLAAPLWAIVAGIAMVTFGFFGAHTVASAWVGQLGLRSKGHASALYLFSFYAGLSILGSAGGWFWQTGGWSGLVAAAAALALAGLAVALSLRRPGGRLPA